MNVMDSFSLRDKVVILTGGAGLYGRQLLEAFAEAGADLHCASRNRAALEEAAAPHRERGARITCHAFDQAREADSLALRDAVLAASGRIDGLVNNAVARPLRGGYQSPIENFDESMRVNATGLFAITRAVGDAMADNGSIVMVGSMMGLVGPEPDNYVDSPGMSGWAADYFFHKGGMANFTRFIASYYGRRGIRCNAIHPGGLFNNQPEPFVRKYEKRTMLGRMANNEDLKGVSVFLLADASRYVTGANIPVDGGYTAK